MEEEKEEDVHPLFHMKPGSLGQYRRPTCDFRDDAGHLRAGANRAYAIVPRFPHYLFDCQLIHEHEPSRACFGSCPVPFAVLDTARLLQHDELRERPRAVMR